MLYCSHLSYICIPRWSVPNPDKSTRPNCTIINPCTLANRHYICVCSTEEEVESVLKMMGSSSTPPEESTFGEMLNAYSALPQLAKSLYQVRSLLRRARALRMHLPCAHTLRCTHPILRRWTRTVLLAGWLLLLEYCSLLFTNH